MEEGIEQNKKDKRKLILIITFFVIAIIVITIFAVKSCEPRTKNLELDEYSAFINANTEFTCEIIKDTALAANTNKMQTKINKIYEKYGFPVDDDEKMFSILKKYENNKEVTAIIKTNSAPCYEGGEPIFFITL